MQTFVLLAMIIGKRIIFKSLLLCFGWFGREYHISIAKILRVNCSEN